MNEGDVVGVLHSIMQSPLTNAMSRAITLNAVMKLSTRFQNTLSDIKDIGEPFSLHTFSLVTHAT